MYPAGRSPECGLLVCRILHVLNRPFGIVPGDPETAKDFVDTCYGTKERKAYCCGSYMSADGAPVTECAEVKSTGPLGVVVGGVGGMLGGLTVP